MAAHVITGNVEHPARLAPVYPDAFTSERLVVFAGRITAEIVRRAGEVPTERSTGR